LLLAHTVARSTQATKITNYGQALRGGRTQIGQRIQQRIIRIALLRYGYHRICLSAPDPLPDLSLGHQRRIS